MKLFKYFISAILLLGIFSCEEYGEINGVLDTLPRKLTLDKASVEFVEGENSLTREVVVTSENISWAITGVLDWLEVSPLEGGSGTTAVKLTASKLPVGDKRNAVIKLESLVPKFKYSHEIKVSQGVDLEFGVSAASLGFSYAAGEKNVAVTTNAPWEAECDASWVTIEKNGDSSLTVSVEDNEAFEERTATITFKREATGDVLSSVEVKQAAAVPNINGHEYVDLGLPSGVKWATCNVGATTPEEYGNYFAWGETSPKSSYTSSNSVTYGKSMGDISGDDRYDAARANWGGDWRLPTKTEFSELQDSSNCTWVWTTQNGVNGYKVTSVRNGNSIFLPAAGYRNGTSLGREGFYGYYWSSTPNESNDDYSCSLGFYSGSHYTMWHYRSDGHGVRPVSE